jgi:hypothetical protein
VSVVGVAGLVGVAVFERRRRRAANGSATVSGVDDSGLHSST